MDVLSPGLSNSIPFRLRRGRDPDPSKRSWLIELLMRLDRGTGRDGKPGESAESVVTRKALLLAFTAATILLGIGLLVIATVAVPIFPTIASTALNGTALAGTTGGVLLWTLFGLVGSVRTVTSADGAGHFTFHLPFVGAAMILGGPTAGVWVAFLATTDRRELQSQPWYGVLANHASIAIAAVAGGITYAWLVTAVAASTGDAGLARFVAVLAAGVVLEMVANGLALVTIKIREAKTWAAVLRIVLDDFRRETLLEIALIWILVVAFATVGWWAPLVIGAGVIAYLALGRKEAPDVITGLPKKIEFLERVDRKVGWMRLGFLPGGTMIVFDLNGFGEINNRYSWAVGDELITVLAQRLTSVFPRTDDVRGHLMGDEFAVYLVGMTDPKKALAMAEVLRTTLGAPIGTSIGAISVGAAIGVVVTPAAGIMTPSTATQFARGEVAEKLAKRVARRTGTGAIHLWTVGDPERVQDVSEDDPAS